MFVVHSIKQSNQILSSLHQLSLETLEDIVDLRQSVLCLGRCTPCKKLIAMIKTGGALRTIIFFKPNNVDCAYLVTVEKQFFF